MNDMSSVIVPKSDQINADDLIGRDMTITIRDVQIRGGQEQPVSIYFEGSDKAFRPCKSMSRVLVYCWGADAKQYIGRSLTLYRDPNVKWGGMAVGGIRISHASHIDSAKTMVLAESKASRKPYIVKPLVVAPGAASATKADPAAAWAAGFIAKVEQCGDMGSLEALEQERATKLAELEEKRPELYTSVVAAILTARDALVSFGPDDTQRGEAHSTVDALAEALRLLRTKVRQEDVTSLRGAWIDKLDPADQDAFSTACAERIDDIKQGRVK